MASSQEKSAQKLRLQHKVPYQGVTFERLVIVLLNEKPNNNLYSIVVIIVSCHLKVNSRRAVYIAAGQNSLHYQKQNRTNEFSAHLDDTLTHPKALKMHSNKHFQAIKSIHHAATALNLWISVSHG